MEYAREILQLSVFAMLVILEVTALLRNVQIIAHRMGNVLKESAAVMKTQQVLLVNIKSVLRIVITMVTALKKQVYANAIAALLSLTALRNYAKTAVPSMVNVLMGNAFVLKASREVTVA